MRLAYRRRGWRRLENNKGVQKRRRPIKLYLLYCMHKQCRPTPIAILPHLFDTGKMRKHGNSTDILYSRVYCTATVRKLLKILVEFFGRHSQHGVIVCGARLNISK